MRKVFFVVVSVLITLSFGACGADDEVFEGVNDSEEIAGQARNDNKNGRDDKDDDEVTEQAHIEAVTAQPSTNAVLINGERVALRVFDTGG